MKVMIKVMITRVTIVKIEQMNLALITITITIAKMITVIAILITIIAIILMTKISIAKLV